MSAKNFVKSDRQAVSQEFIFVKSRSSLVCSSLVKNISQEFKAGPPLDLSFWSFLTFLHRGREEVERHLL